MVKIVEVLAALAVLLQWFLALAAVSHLSMSLWLLLIGAGETIDSNVISHKFWLLVDLANVGILFILGFFFFRTLAKVAETEIKRRSG